MATQKQPPGEAHENPDQSIKARKFQLFEQVNTEGAFKAKAFAEYVKATPPAPMNPGIKAALWAVAVVVALLFLASLFGRSTPSKGRQAGTPDGNLRIETAHETGIRFA